MKRDFISLHDWSAAEVAALLEQAAELKAKQRARIPHALLPGKTLALIFEKPSLRTRVTFEAGMTQLGGHAIYLAHQDIRLGERETVADVARNLCRWVDGIVARTFRHQVVVELAEHATVPVINGLTDLLHPCEILGDLLTIQEKRGSLPGCRVAFIGDGNNVANSWCTGAAKTGVHLTIACPKGYEPDPSILHQAREDAKGTGARIQVVHDAAAAARGADVLYTDVWTSMGQEEERAKRVNVFQAFQVNRALVSLARPDVLVMHCLPAHRGEEITDEVIEGPHSVVFDEAENRLHAQKALLVTLLGDHP
ncbi:MAG TPA: ornithine carbamoyltransferase, partial [Candidatus Methylomirabilis sp.]|nr:ornithine carbamoyltransferase [Candidatus Methylomirabilis sp.]